MRSWILSLALTTLTFSGCLGVEDDTRPTATTPTGLRSYETDNAAIPAKNNNRLWLHADGATLTMDTSEDGPKGAVEGRIDPSAAEQWWAFTLAPTPARQLDLTGGAAVATIMFETGPGPFGLPPELRVRMYFADALVGSGVAEGQLSGPTTVSLNVPAVIPPNTEVRLDVCLCGGQATVVPSYSIFADGQSFLDLPVVTPVFVQGGGTSNGTARVAGAAERIEGDVVTERQGDRWIARKTITFTNQLAIESAELEFSTGAGSLDLATWDPSGYEIVASLEGRGDTEQEALQSLADLRVDHDAPVEGGLASIYTRATTADDDWTDQSASLRGSVPAPWEASETTLSTGAGSIDVDGIHGQILSADTGAGSIDLRATDHESIVLDTGSGSIDLENVDADEAQLDTGSGSLDLAGSSFGTLAGSTASGSIDVSDVEAIDASLDTGAGSISVSLENTASGRVTLDTGAGTVHLEVPDSSSFGYDATASSAAGGATIDLADTDPVGEQTPSDKHVQTRGYATKSIQVEIRAESGAGSVDVTGR